MKKGLIIIALLIASLQCAYAYYNYNISSPMHPANPMNPINMMLRTNTYNVHHTHPHRHHNTSFKARCYDTMEMCIRFGGGHACINSCNGIR